MGAGPLPKHRSFGHCLEPSEQLPAAISFDFIDGPVGAHRISLTDYGVENRDD